MGQYDKGAPAVAVYSRSARRLHWSKIPVGLFMVRDGVATDFAAPSGILYDGHKLLGLLILLLAAVRLAYRLAHGTPPSQPSLAAWRKTMSHVTHWAIYVMLFAVPVLGWLAISYYRPFRTFGLALPVLTAESGDTAQRFFALHRLAAYALIVLIGRHVGAVLLHYIVRNDGVMRRMLPSAGQRA
jgi:cytochrome b561